MKRNIYGIKMFIADLIIVSFWALFAWHDVGWINHYYAHITLI